MFVVDTNVLVYAADQSVPEHARCRALKLTHPVPFDLDFSSLYICVFTAFTLTASRVGSRFHFRQLATATLQLARRRKTYRCEMVHLRDRYR